MKASSEKPTAVIHCPKFMWYHDQEPAPFEVDGDRFVFWLAVGCIVLAAISGSLIAFGKGPYPPIGLTIGVLLVAGLCLLKWEILYPDDTDSGDADVPGSLDRV